MGRIELRIGKEGYIVSVTKRVMCFSSRATPELAADIASGNIDVANVPDEVKIIDLPPQEWAYSELNRAIEKVRELANAASCTKTPDSQ